MMRPLRAIHLGVALLLLTVAGAVAALVLLSSLGSGPDNDPVGRLRPVLAGLAPTPAPPIPETTSSGPTTEGFDDDD